MMLPLQPKLGELHVSAQHEYSLFDSYSKWSNDRPMSLNPMNANDLFNENEPISRVDASKAPGYRGASINSPVSSKTSSNSATPPSTVLATQAPTSNSNQMQQGANYGENVIKPIGQGPIQRPGSNVNNNMGYQRNAGLYEYSNNSHDYNSYVNPQVSRLNPKASSFTSNNQNQPKNNPGQYGGGQSFMSNNNNFMKSPGSGSSSGASRWYQDFGNYQGMEYGNSSPSMSPNNNSQVTPMQSNNGPIDDSRKAPAPIGNERNYKYFGAAGAGYAAGGYSMDMESSSMMNPGMRRNSWMDNKQNQCSWPTQPNNMNSRGHYEMSNDFAMQDFLQVSFQNHFYIVHIHLKTTEFNLKSIFKFKYLFP